MSDDLIVQSDAGFYCPAGDFHIDPWRPVDRAVVTHGHADHARWGCGRYLVARPGLEVFRTRLGKDAVIDTLEYGETLQINRVKVSFHPAGHILGSAQVRVEAGGQVWVASGDYKTGPDNTCAAFEPVRCHTFITESTFGLPIYRWQPQSEVFAEVNAWWRSNKEAGRTSILYGYSLGKAQRLLSGLDPDIGPIYTHGAVEKLNDAYRRSGVTLPPTSYARAVRGFDWSGSMIIAPPSAHGSPWTRRFAPASTAFASGWMRIRGTRRRKAVDRGFVLSDHADWPGLLDAIHATGATRIWATHGYTAILARYLVDKGLRGETVQTQFGGDAEAAADEAEADGSPP